ncbi:Similar to Smad nuclear-interacting protein 1; acc. no. Q8TAD8 [Pyronema omphalodes CBS 100304]|uniref:Similar to Smad nuclear-interacting protein 1 acc. no. Q8TAD8 n=1 Tax=Pyronema omphalodes (strain CBS 100304) TaxID=1076935 RepID=U4L552_PYROM|nr:Similar to Smad nuclear-interacting protein 1; acc. no. Q8TAD8 [Pyronema omphalodes CBS 100304]
MPRSQSPPPRRRRSRSRSTGRDRSYRSRDEKDRRDRPRDRSRDRRRKPRTDGYIPPSRSPPRTGTRAPLPAPGATSDALEAPVDKQKPNFSNTGLLAAATNTVNDVVLKYSEPADSRKAPANPIYKLFIFKDGQIIEEVELNHRSCWLIGRDRAVADLPVDHPSCSKQHAVLQFRWSVKTDEFGEKKGQVRLYVMDLESANGTMLQGDVIEGRRFVECREGDLLRFGMSTREYVIMVDRG